MKAHVMPGAGLAIGVAPSPEGRPSPAGARAGPAAAPADTAVAV